MAGDRFVSLLSLTKTSMTALAAVAVACALSVGVVLGNVDFSALGPLVSSWFESSAGALHWAWQLCVVVLCLRRGWGDS